MDQAVAPPKETKAQRTERLKLAKNPWEAFDEVRTFAREGRTSVVPDWASLYFKWWGIYTQGDGVGAIGGKGGEGLATDYFMMRIGIPNGILTAHQLAPSPASPATTRAILPTSPSARTSSSIGSPSSRSPKLSMLLTPSAFRPRAPAATSSATSPAARSPDLPHDEFIDASPLAHRNRAHARRQPRFLQPAAQVQDFRHRLPAPGAITPRSTTSALTPVNAGGRDRLFAARRRWPLQRAAPRRSAQRIPSAAIRPFPSFAPSLKSSATNRDCARVATAPA